MPLSTRDLYVAAAAALLILVLAKWWNSRKAGAQRSGFSGDDDNWPSAGVFGNLGDTLPYGNYAGGADMYYPTTQPNAATWTLG